MGKDAPDWQDTIYQIQEGGLSYPHSAWKIEGISQIIRQVQFGIVDISELYIVPTDRVCYLTSIWLWGYNTAAEKQEARIMLREEAGGTWRLWYLKLLANSQAGLTLSFPMPIEIGEGGGVYFKYGGLGGLMHLTITGYELPATA